MELFNLVLDKYGLRAAIAIFILKTLWEFVIGTTRKYLKAIGENTEAINKLSGRLDKVTGDLEIAFINIKEVRQKQGLGSLSRPDQ